MFLSFSVGRAILKSVTEAKGEIFTSRKKRRISVINLIKEFNTDKENMYVKLKDGNT